MHSSSFKSASYAAVSQYKWVEPGHRATTFIKIRFASQIIVLVTRNPKTCKWIDIGRFLEVGHSKVGPDSAHHSKRIALGNWKLLISQSSSWARKSLRSLSTLSSRSLPLAKSSNSAKAAIAHRYTRSSPSPFITLSPLVELLNTLNQSVWTNWCPLQVHYEN